LIEHLAKLLPFFPHKSELPVLFFDSFLLSFVQGQTKSPTAQPAEDSREAPASHRMCEVLPRHKKLRHLYFQARFRLRPLRNLIERLTRAIGKRPPPLHSIFITPFISFSLSHFPYDAISPSFLVSSPRSDPRMFQTPSSTRTDHIPHHQSLTHGARPA
jgi:hypothetical protein